MSQPPDNRLVLPFREKSSNDEQQHHQKKGTKDPLELLTFHSLCTAKAHEERGESYQKCHHQPQQRCREAKTEDIAHLSRYREGIVEGWEEVELMRIEHTKEGERCTIAHRHPDNRSPSTREQPPIG